MIKIIVYWGVFWESLCGPMMKIIVIVYWGLFWGPDVWKLPFEPGSQLLKRLYIGLKEGPY